MSTRQEFVVYLSSTLADLGPERDVALKTIAEFGVVKTSYRASEEGVVNTCTGDVRRSNLYIGILGQRYGYVPPQTENNPENKSITELEYESCEMAGQPKISRLVFIKPTAAGIDHSHIDALSRPDTASRMEAFLARAGKDQVAYQFKTLEDFRAELRIRVKEHADQFHRENALSKTMLSGSETWNRQLAPVGIACVPGNDEAQRQAIQQCGSNRFQAFELSPDDPDYLAILDAGIQKAQLGCLLVTPASLTRLNAGPSTQKVSAALNMLHVRIGNAVLICEGVSKAALPPEWLHATVIELQENGLTAATAATLETLYDALRVHVPSLTVDPRLALPYLVLAPTRSEAESLCEQHGNGFLAFKSDAARKLRKEEFDRIAVAARLIDKNWPKNIYGPERQHWKCFGSASTTAHELILRSVKRINEAVSGSREKRFLKSAKLVPRRYRLEEFLDDHFGSRKAVEAVRNSGCLFVVDELALLHPALRAAADTLLVGAKTAIVSVSPCDPAHRATEELLDDFSYLRVGSVVSRFKTDHDPRCEIALNNVDRVERWLRITIPELISSTEELESNPALVARAASLLA